jgi:hypothetical protein
MTEKTLEITGKNPTRETEKAWAFDFGELMWFPKSVCSFDGTTLSVPMWLAKKRDMTGWVRYEGVQWAS